MKAVVILCTAPADHAHRLASGLVEARLAACVNVVAGLTSFYRWEGAIQNDPEVQLLIKTQAARFDEVAAWLDTHHPYDVPEIIALEVSRASAAYGSWLVSETTSTA